jgi:hypothetical protein
MDNNLIKILINRNNSTISFNLIDTKFIKLKEKNSYNKCFIIEDNKKDSKKSAKICSLKITSINFISNWEKNFNFLKKNCQKIQEKENENEIKKFY